jgi:cell division protein FtsB
MKSKSTTTSSDVLGALMSRRWTALGIVAAAAFGIAMFVGNALRVGKLTEEIERQKQERQRIVHQNEILRREIIRLESPERIGAVAKSRLGLVQAAAAPIRIPQAMENKESRRK